MGGQGGSAPPNCGSHRSQPFSFKWHSPLPPILKPSDSPAKRKNLQGNFSTLSTQGTTSFFSSAVALFLKSFFSPSSFFAVQGHYLTNILLYQAMCQLQKFFPIVVNSFREEPISFQFLPLLTYGPLGHSATTWTKIHPILNPSFPREGPRVDNC